MSISPLARPDVDEIQITDVLDFAPSTASYLRTIRTRQHALMSEWGGPPTARTLYLQASGDDAWTVTIRVPPGTVDLGIAVLAFGNGTLTITSSADAVGTALVSVAPIDSGAVDEEAATWIASTGSLSSSLGASSGRAVTVRSSVVWTWVDVDLTFTVTGVTTNWGILALETRPIHIPAD